MNARPLISVIMPAHNSAAYIGSSIKSVLDQDYWNWELIIINDGSTDDTLQKIDSYTDPRIRVIAQERRGVSASRNAGLSIARGELIAFLDSDDLWPRRKLSEQQKYLENHPSIGLVYSDHYSFRNGSRVAYCRPYREPLIGIEMPEALALWNPIALLTVMVRKEVLSSLIKPRFDCYLFGTEDWDLWIRISQIAQIKKMSGQFGFYRIHENGISRSGLRQYRNTLKVLRKYTGLRGDCTDTSRKAALYCAYRRYALTKIRVNWLSFPKYIVGAMKRYGIVCIVRDMISLIALRVRYNSAKVFLGRQIIE